MEVKMEKTYMPKKRASEEDKDLEIPESQVPKKQMTRCSRSCSSLSKKINTDSRSLQDVSASRVLIPYVVLTKNFHVIDLSGELEETKTQDVEIKRRFENTIGFPRYENGDVYIEVMKNLGAKYSYQLHSSMLSRVSPWFERTLDYSVVGPDETLANITKNKTGILARYELDMKIETKTGVLFRAPLTKIIILKSTKSFDTATATASTPPRYSKSQSDAPETPPDSDGFQESISQTLGNKPVEIAQTLKMEEEKINTENLKQDMNSASAGINLISGESQVELCETYNNLFLIYYSKSPHIDQDDIQIALRQSELLFNLAECYGSVSIVRPYISSCINHYGREMYKAILLDPPRWLFLSIFLESAPIFKEAMIHIAGNYPLWQSDTVKENDFDDEIREIIHSKVLELREMRTNIEKCLYMCTISDKGVTTKLDSTDKSAHNSWLVVQIWRDWFSSCLCGTTYADKTNLDGMVYRQMREAGKSYLPLASVKEKLETLRGINFDDSDVQAVEEDLNLMKEFAQNAAMPLCVNNSMLSVEEEGIKYLTCTKVDKNELPWINKSEF